MSKSKESMKAIKREKMDDEKLIERIYLNELLKRKRHIKKKLMDKKRKEKQYKRKEEGKQNGSQGEGDVDGE